MTLKSYNIVDGYIQESPEGVVGELYRVADVQQILARVSYFDISVTQPSEEGEYMIIDEDNTEQLGRWNGAGKGWQCPFSGFTLKPLYWRRPLTLT
ncbi:hypothetical protein GR11A_00093 [Vibrio phage vB_VcorM_GR11A]|nr:hypothetical protein GR11A_00093 [Vibrio phage vB_VcorM_GR11A]